MNHTSYQIEIPANSDVVVFYNGIKALNFKGLVWLWQQILSSSLNKVIKAEGCVETKLSLCNHKEAIIISYWLNETSLIKFFHSPLHRQMMKDMKKIITADSKAIAVFNETYRPLRSGRYFNDPQGLAKIYPTIES